MNFPKRGIVFYVTLLVLPLITNGQQKETSAVINEVNTLTYHYYENTNKSPLASLNYAEKAFAYYDEITSDKLKFTLAINYATALYINERYQDAISILDNIEPFENEEKEQALYFTLRGLIKSDLNHISEAETHYTTALEIYRKLGDSDNEFAILNNLGLLYNNIGDYKKSLEYYLSCYDIISDLKVKIDRYKYYMNIGTVNFNLNNYESSLASFTHALEDASVNLDSLRIFKAHEKIAQTNVNLNKLDESINHYKNALRGYKTLGLNREVSNILLNMGDVYHLKNNKQLEFENYNEALEIAIKYNFNQESYQASLQLAHYYQEQENYTKARKLYKVIIDNQTQIINLETIREAYNGLYEIEKLNKNALLSLDYLENYLNYDQIIREKQTISQNEQIKSKYELKQKEYELDNLKVNYRLNELELENQNQKIEGLILLTILIVIVLILILTFYIQKRKAERALAAKNEKIKSQNSKLVLTNTEIKAQRKELTDLNKIKDQLLSVIAHDVKSPMTDLYNLLFILRNNMESMPKEELTKNLAIVEANTSNILNLLNNILNWIISQSSGITVKSSQFSIQELINDNLKLIESSIVAKDLKVTFENKTDIDLFTSDLNIIDFALRNVLSNAVKFTNNNGNIAIKLLENAKNKIEIRVEDSGIGFKEETHVLLKDNRDRVPSALGTNTEKGYGIGLSLCKKMLAKINSSISYQKNEPYGSVFILNLKSMNH